jgi:hypothetical protein
MHEEKGAYYFRGRWFDNEKDMFNWVKEWRQNPLNEEDAGEILARFNKDLITCVFLTTQGMNNGQFGDCVEKIFDYAMKILREESEE